MTHAERLPRYKAILEEFGIDPTNTHYSGGEDAAEHLSGETPLKRFCVVTTGGEFVYAKASWSTLEEAKAYAMVNIIDDVFPEAPVAIIDLDTGARLEPKWSSIQWTQAA